MAQNSLGKKIVILGVGAASLLGGGESSQYFIFWRR